RVRHVIAQIPALVDARHDEIGKPFEHVRDGDVDAVGRRAVDRKNPFRDVFEAEWMAERQRVADRARLGDRRDDRHLADFTQRAREGFDAVRSIAVIVRDQDANHVTIINSSSVATSARAAPSPNAAAAPYALQMTPKSTLAASAPTPCTAV